MLVRYERRFYNGNPNELVAHVKDASQLIGDHIHPIALGGDEWDINNIQTLRKKCNKAKTALDLKKIAELRKVEKILSGNQTTLHGAAQKSLI